jgi:release factor glutamine methyltransferase
MQLDRLIDIDTADDVYNPSDDSYLLLKIVQVARDETFLEVGAGTGLIAIHAAKLGAKVTATDVNPHAVELTRRNAARNQERIQVLQGDLFEKVNGYFDVIAFNPPYLPGDSSSTSWIERSWSGGEKGSEIPISFLDQAWRHLAPSGRIYMVLSSLTGLPSVLKTARERYESEMLEEKRMFFESLFAYRFKVKRPSP